MIILLAGCQKVEPERIIMVRTASFEELTVNSCKLIGKLHDLGEDGVDDHGFYLSLTSNLNEASLTLKLGAAKERGQFSTIAEGLSPETTYYTWAFAAREGDTKYGDPISFTTLSVTKPVVETGDIINVTASSAEVECIIHQDGGAPVSERGICWDSISSPTRDKSHSEHGTGIGSFTGTMHDLTPGKNYFVRAYAINSAGTEYGEEKGFETPVEEFPPELYTHDLVDVTWNSAIGGGTITSDGNSEILEKGLCWSLYPNPTIDDFYLSSESPGLTFYLPLTDLQAETTYFVRAYAKNSVGLSYGDEKEFSTVEPPIAPTISTYEVSAIEHTSVTSGGEISSEGGSPVISKGLCWSATVTEPTLENQHLEYGVGDEPFTMEISELTPNTKYYIRAYARNEVGTGYGNVEEFQTLFLCGSQLVDERDGKTYFTVQIGEQCWMAENLNVGEFITISAGQGNNGTLEKYCYADLETNCDTYGGLYTWDEMMQYTELESTQGVCPAGWHIPSDYEWKLLEQSLGMPIPDSDASGWRGSDEGGKLKSAGTSFWNPPNEGASNSSLFSAFPGGMVFSDGNSTGMGDFAVFWTSTPILDTQAWYRYLHTDESRIYRVDGYRPNTTSVRCIKD